MNAAPLEPHRVSAYNTAHDSENKIHDDATARRFGFGGGLVPGVDVYGAFGNGRYGYGSGTSFAAAEVSGAAALVWAADPALTAQRVARLLEETASGHGTWTRDLGFGVVDVAAAVGRARTLAER